jgi:flagellar biosynthesis protein FlhG
VTSRAGASPLESTPNKPDVPRARLVAVGGGKGGVGKTFLSANLAVALAREGYRVIAIDTDVEGPNLHTLVGVKNPARTLADFIAGRESQLLRLIVATPTDNLGLIAATQGNLAGAQPDAQRRADMVAQLRRLPCDFVIVDCGAGAHAATLDYFLVSDDGLIVVHPEPTSVENAYTFVRAAFYRRMQAALQKHDVRALVREAMDQRNARGISTPLDLLREIELMDPEDGQRFVDTMRRFRPRVVVNEVATADDVKLGFSIASVCRRFFGIDADYIGYLNRDAAVREAVKQRRALLDVAPDGDAAVYLRRIARKLAEGVPLPSEATAR